MKGEMLSSYLEGLFDALCIVSFVGITSIAWNPKLLTVAHKRVYLPHLSQYLSGMRVVFISDAHVNRYLSSGFLDPIQKNLIKLQADLILFGGDLLTYASISNPERTNQFLSILQAPLGVFLLGNHDYAEYATIDTTGEAISEFTTPQPILQGLQRLFGSLKTKKTKRITSPLPLNPRFCNSMKTRH